LYLPKGRPVKVKIRSSDVLHSFYLPHFRVKMDAVPVIPTTFWFTPKYTTQEMKKRTGNEDFKYELACAELCGKGHSSMQANVVVVEPDSFQHWMKQQATWKETMQQAEKWQGLKDEQQHKIDKWHEKHGSPKHHGDHDEEDSHEEGHAQNKKEESENITQL
jgi:cytochrome c oxidase subunit 2